ncbi:hypothetical protein GOD90_10430 [Sinorhizobium medicae]|nr:hypothetical protein [Sinorhizobium medicae]
MTPAITLWLAFVLAAGAILFCGGTRRQAIALVIVAIATAPATLTTLGHAAPWQPAPGHYTVLGARIDIDVAIYVLLDGEEPRLYRLPYSAEAANQLQAAQDGTADGEGGVALRVDQDGSPGFSEDSATPEPPKQAERALLP